MRAFIYELHTGKILSEYQGARENLDAFPVRIGRAFLEVPMDLAVGEFPGRTHRVENGQLVEQPVSTAE